MGKASHEFTGVLFDMDGTLVDTEPMWDEAERMVMAEFDVPWTAEDNAFCVGGPADRVTSYMADLVSATGQPRPDSSLMWNELVRFMVQGVSDGRLIIQPGALDLLADARNSGLPTALVSSSPRVLMDGVLGGLGSEWFDFTLAGDEVDLPKPDPQPYQRAAAAIGVDPRWCVAVEDSTIGVRSAKAAGAFIVAVTHTADFHPEPRRALIPSLTSASVAGFDEWFTPPVGQPD